MKPGPKPTVSTPENIKEWKKLYNEGITLTEIAKVYNTTKQLISAKFKKHYPGICKHYVPSDIQEEWRVLYNMGEPAGRIAKQFGYNIKTVLKVLRNSGIKIRRR